MISEINGYTTKDEWFLGKGSFGSVYKAEKDGKFYAIKIFQTEFLKAEYRKFLDREVEALKKIHHPNVVQIHDSGIFTDKGFEYFYIVLELIEGTKLSNYVGTITEERAIAIIESITSTLNVIHKEGILHRDLKPDNILIRQDGVPIILDFGLSKLIDYTSIIQTGEQVGTYHYMSPEQITDSKNIDPRSDYFSVGVILYELLTGTLPFTAPNLPALIFEIQNHYPEIPSLKNPSISNQTENVILRLLEKSPHKRYQSASDIINAFKTSVPSKIRRLGLDMHCYIRLLNNEKEVFKEAITKGMIDHVVYPANLFEGFKPTVKLIKDSGIPFTTDPATNRLTYPAFSKTKGVQELPYASGDPIRPIQKKDFDSILQVQEYVRKVLVFQIESGVSQLMTPFFYAKDPNDEWFSINLKLLRESIDLRDREYPHMPLWSGVCMNIDGWHEDEIKNAILDAYVRDAPDGFFVYGDPIGNQSNLTQVFHYADLLKRLQIAAGVPVVAARVNGLGLILLSMGIAGISTGVAGLDSFHEDLLSDMADGYSSGPRYYIPELLCMVSLKNSITTKLIDLSHSSIGPSIICKCEYCSGILSGSLSSSNIKLHFLRRRQQELDELAGLNQLERLDWIEARVSAAINYQKGLNREGIKLINDYSYLNTWKSLIDRIRKPVA